MYILSIVCHSCHILYLILGACLSVTTLQLHTSFASPKCSIIRFLMALQRYDLCGFLRKLFVLQFGVINPRCMCFRHGCKNHQSWSPLPASLLSPLASFQRLWYDNGFFLTLRVCTSMLSCQLPWHCVFLWYPLTFWLAKLVCMNLEQHCCVSITLVSSPILNV